MSPSLKYLIVEVDCGEEVLRGADVVDRDLGGRGDRLAVGRWGGRGL
jgi:hypothetical protein